MNESGEVLIVASQRKGESISERVQGFLSETQDSHGSVVVMEVIGTRMIRMMTEV